MRRYRHRSAEQSAMIEQERRQEARIDTAAVFGRRAPLRCELGFGHGSFLSHMAAAHPDEDFIGVEHDPLRCTKTAAKSLQLDAHNVQLYCDDAQSFMRHRLAPASLKRCYVLFSILGLSGDIVVGG